MDAIPAWVALQATLKQLVLTRCNSTLIVDNQSLLESIPDRTLQKLLIDLNEEMLTQTVKVLEHLDVTAIS